MARILIIGNGFDIAHGLPTKYEDFLDFCILWDHMKKYPSDPHKFESAKNELEDSKKVSDPNAKIHESVLGAIKCIFSHQKYLIDSNGYATIHEVFLEKESLRGRK